MNDVGYVTCRDCEQPFEADKLINGLCFWCEDTEFMEVKDDSEEDNHDFK